MGRRYVEFPVEEEYERFCEFMEYPLLSEKDDFYVYKVPHNHLCQFLINYEKWIQGVFDKDDFIESTNI